jgi:hypothetical protein
MTVIEILNQYGFATLAAIAMGWFIFFIYTYITQKVTKKLSDASGALIQLIDKIRRLDNDIIRLRSKVNTIITLQEQEKDKNKDK